MERITYNVKDLLLHLTDYFGEKVLYVKTNQRAAETNAETFLYTDGTVSHTGEERTAYIQIKVGFAEENFDFINHQTQPELYQQVLDVLSTIEGSPITDISRSKRS